ncbi:MAG: hypothetical protein AAF915_19830 [Cyanobacteria bacterium P01_D01_bin.50]
MNTIVWVYIEFASIFQIPFCASKAQKQLLTDYRSLTSGEIMPCFEEESLLRQHH